MAAKKPDICHPITHLITRSIQGEDGTENRSDKAVFIICQSVWKKKIFSI